MGFFSNKGQDKIAESHPVRTGPGSEAPASLDKAVFDFRTILEEIRKSFLDEPSADLVFEEEKLLPPRFLRITHLPRQQDDEGRLIKFQNRERELLTALYGLGLPVVVRLEQRSGQLFVLIGIGMGKDSNTLLSAVHGAITCHFPGSTAVEVPDQEFEYSKVSAVLVVGTPQPPAQAIGVHYPDLGSLVSSMRSRDFGLTLLARPIPRKRVLEMYAQASSAIREWSSYVREGIDISAQAASIVTRAVRRDRVDRNAQQAVDWMEALLDRFSKGQSEGLWEWNGILWARDEEALRMASSLLGALYSGPESLPEPIRILPLKRETDLASLITGRKTIRLRDKELCTALPSSHLAALYRFPSQSFPGFITTAKAEFSTADISPVPDRPVVIGTILDRGSATGRQLSIPLNALAAHGLVVGMTGAGKTNACMAILKEVDRHGVPFLVIEPAKNEYRSLLRDNQFMGRLRIFTLGDERTSPFRLNPFEFPEGFPVGTHLDFLKSVFTSSFSMYGPMPHILEESIVRVFEKRGWDLASGTNVYQQGVDRAFLFPTLYDLLDEIDPVVQAIGYAQELTMDIRGALKTRVKSLLTGPKGMMLGAPRSTPLADLLAYPTVLELSLLGDDQEKALIMGLLLVGIYEARHVQGGVADKLVHVTLIEEAHRILKNVSTAQTNPEIANVVGKAVDTFNNILSEIRAFGEGFLIAEQIPAKLSPDAIKNTGFKLTHRLHAPDDREAVGGSMVLAENQKRHLALLPDLSAVAFGAGLGEAVMVSVTPSKPEFRRAYESVSDKDVISSMAAYHDANRAVFDRFPACHLCPNKCHRPLEALEVFENPECDARRSFRRILMAWSIPGNGEPAPMARRHEDENKNYCITAHLIHSYFRDRSSFYRLLPPERVLLERSLAEVLLAGDRPFLQCLGEFMKGWREILERKKVEQKAVCKECTQPFCYGYEMDGFVNDLETKESFNEATTPGETRQFLERIVERTMGTVAPALWRRLSYCFFVRRHSELGNKGAHGRFLEIERAWHG